MESAGNRSHCHRACLLRTCALLFAVTLLFSVRTTSAQDVPPNGRMISPPSNVPVDGPSTTSGSTRSVGTTLAALGVILLIGLGLVRMWQKRSPIAGRTLPAEVWESLGSASIDARFQVRLVRLGTRILVLGQSDQALETLSEITDPEEVAHLMALCQSDAADTSHNSFREMYQQFVQRVHSGSPPSQRSEMPRG